MRHTTEDAAYATSKEYRGHLERLCRDSHGHWREHALPYLLAETRVIGGDLIDLDPCGMLKLAQLVELAGAIGEEYPSDRTYDRIVTAVETLFAASGKEYSRATLRHALSGEKDLVLLGAVQTLQEALKKAQDTLPTR